MSGEQGAPAAGVHQTGKADRDQFSAGRDQTVNVVNRQVGLAGVPHPAEVDPPGPVRGLPRRPVRVFEGRTAALRMLEAAVSARGEAVVTQAVYGLGGVGKTELALHYADAHGAEYRLVWWITASDAAQVEAGLAGLAARLCPTVAVAGTTAEAAVWATGWLQAHDGWLLILDNVEDPADVEPLLAQLVAGHVILTTRRDLDWARLADPVRLDVLDPAAAAALLIRRTGRRDDGDEETAGQIATELGFLPLALEQAAAYINQQKIAPAAYLDSLRRVPARMHAAATDAHRTIARLWDLHITAVGDRDPAAARLLGVLVRYAPDAIPRAMLGGAAPREETDEALGLLASYSMIALTAESVSIHRLLQAVILAQPDGTLGTDADSLRTAALDWLEHALPDDPSDVATWPPLRALVPHAEALTGHFPPGVRPVSLGIVHNAIALFLTAQGDHARALPLRESALAIAEAALGPGHAETAIRLSNLAATYRNLGRSADALALHERALAAGETARGPDHPSTAIQLGNLAATYRDLGRAADAIPLHTRALAIMETALGPGHPSTAVALDNFAASYRSLGRPADALALQERALAITETALGPENPNTAIRLNNLATTYRDLGRSADAIPLHERALAITESALGPNHPVTATRLANLAITYRVLGRPADALPLQERALAITETALRSGHPRAANLLGSLADTYLDLGRPADALPLHERALAITETALGPDHPNTAIRLNNLADTYRDLGRAADAALMEKRVEQIRQRLR